MVTAKISISDGLFYSKTLAMPSPETAGVGIAASLVLTDVLVFQLVAQTDSLGLVLDRFAVDNGGLEHLRDTSVNGITLHSHPNG